MPPGGEFVYSGADDEPDVTIKVGYENGAHYLCSVEISARDFRSQVTDADIRQLTRQHAEGWVQWIMANLLAYEIAADGTLGPQAPREVTTTFTELRRAVRRGRSDWRHTEVARVYLEGGRPGAQAVSEEFGISH